MVGRMDFQCSISSLFTYCRNLKFDIEVPTETAAKEAVAMKDSRPIAVLENLRNIDLLENH